MEELVVRHTYAEGLAWDLSSWRNHGRLRNVSPGVGAFRDTMRFDQPSSAIIVRRSDSLRRFDSVRVQARVLAEPPAGPGQRLNVVEGQLSFAFFVNPDFSLSCTFVDRNNQWIGVTSAPGAVTPSTWHEIEFRYDGISAMEQFVDGTMTGARYDLRGVARGVGPNGIYIGHWPEPADQYTFRGHITDVSIWRREDRENLDNVFDPCCLDERAWFARLDDFRKSGLDREYVQKLQSEWRELEEEFVVRMRGDSEAGLLAERAITERLSDAIRQRDYAGLSQLMPDVFDWVMDVYSQQEILDFAERAQRWLEALPVSLEEIEKVAREACLSDLIDTMRTSAEREAERRR
jgi:hypothetical protein